MAKKITWNADNTLSIAKPRATKKLTGTRFAAVLGLNKWSTPFQIWCQVTKTYDPPFEDTIYTVAGKTIEPKQYEYIRNERFWERFESPTDVYGKDYFSKTRGDFYGSYKILGGMWDYRQVNKDGKPVKILEMKTTKRAEDWLDDIPEYYALQAALYGYLSDVDDIMMVCTILEEKDYDHPEDFVCSKDNTFIREFKISERYPDMDDIVQKAIDWWDTYVVIGTSPEYDEKLDVEYLAALRKTTVNPTTKIDDLYAEAETLTKEIEEVTSTVADKENRLKKVKELIKEEMQKSFQDGDTKVEGKHGSYVYTVSKGATETVDKKKLTEDGLFDKYVSVKDKYTLTMKEVK